MQVAKGKKKLDIEQWNPHIIANFDRGHKAQLWNFLCSPHLWKAGALLPPYLWNHTQCVHNDVPPAGVDLVSGISGSGDVSHLAASTRRWMQGGVVMETALLDGTSYGLQHTLWNAFIVSCHNELISGLLLGDPLSQHKSYFAVSWWKDRSTFSK